MDWMIFLFSIVQPDFKWYKTSKAQVRWESHLSSTFIISKGMKQGSILSPRLFNMFLNDLLISLKSSANGIKICDFSMNSLAYADDLNLFSTTKTGLQNLMDACVLYAMNWRMKFNSEKTKIICIGKQPLKCPPVWNMGEHTISLSDNTSILGVNFSSALSSQTHIATRIRSCRQSIFKLTSIGMSYPGLNSDCNAFLWNSISWSASIYQILV